MSLGVKNHSKELKNRQEIRVNKYMIVLSTDMVIYPLSTVIILIPFITTFWKMMTPFKNN